jgi:LPXTG-motif cell wall-anchored protein
MGEAQLTQFGEQFALALLVPFVWLLVCKAIRGLRRRPGFCYMIASALVLVASLALPNGPNPIGLLAGVISLAILYFLYKRRRRKQSFDAATIISYENHNIF